MNHPEKTRLDAFAYDTLNDDQSVAEHVTNCEECHREVKVLYAEQEFLRTSLKSLIQDIPLDRLPAVPEIGASDSDPGKRWSMAILPLAAATILIGLLVLILGHSTSNPGKEKLRMAEKSMAEGHYSEAAREFEEASQLDVRLADRCRTGKKSALDSLARVHLELARRLADEGKYEEANAILRVIFTDLSETSSFEGAKTLTREIVEKLEKENERLRRRSLPQEKK